MGLLNKAGEWMARRKIDGARKGKEGPQVKEFLKALDGRKRFFVLLAYVIVTTLKAAGVGDYEGFLGVAMRLLDYTPDMLPLPVGVIAGTVAGVIALVHAAIKAYRKTGEAAETVSLR